MKKKLFIILFFSSTLFSFSQSNAELLRLADIAYDNGNFASAAYFYEKILSGGSVAFSDMVFPYEMKSYSKPIDDSQKSGEKNDSLKINPDTSIKSAEIKTDTARTRITISETSTEILYVMNRVAESYRLSFNYEKAEFWYAKLNAVLSRDYPLTGYWYGDALLKNSKYDEAMDVFTEFALDAGEAPEFLKKAEQGVKNCSFAIKAKSKSNKKITAEKLDSTVNSIGSNFGVTYGEENSVFFSSSKNITTSKDGISQMQCDIYRANIEESNLTGINKLPASINSPNNEGAPVLSPDKTKLFFTRWSDDKKNQECAIYVSKFLNGQWLTPKKLSEEVNREGFKTMHAALSADGTNLFFSSNRPGGKGKMDLWQCTIDEMDNISDVVNLGKPINTAEDEVTPFFHSFGAFYFSSDGHVGMGGLDIFETATDNNFSSPVENLGHPFNSGKDDAYFIVDENMQGGFFSSDRDGCADCNSGNCYSIYKFTGEQMKITMSGKIFDAATKKIIPNALVYFTETHEMIEPISAFTDENGFYSTTLHKNLEFYIIAQKVRYFKDATSKNTIGIEETTNLTHDFYLKQIPQGDIEIPGIEYDYDKATLRPRSKQILDTLSDFLKLNDNLIVEINSHTDERGNDDYNMKLSDARAKSCVDYLIENGIVKERLVFKGYGESKPLIVNAKTEEEHQHNRRTAFRILSEDYKPVKKSQFIKKDE